MVKKYLYFLYLFIQSIIITNPFVATASSHTVQATVNVSTFCSINVSPLNFGSFNTTAMDNATISANSNIDLTCTTGTDFVIGIGASGLGGQYIGGSGRNLTYTNPNTNTTHFIAFELYRDPTYQNIFASLGSTQHAVAGSTTIPVYGKITNQTGIYPGIYTDSLIVTVDVL